MPSSSSMIRILPRVSIPHLKLGDQVVCLRRSVRRASRQTDGQRDDHGRAAAELAFDVDLAAVHLHDPIGNGEAEAGALSSRLGRKEWSEELVQVLRRDAAARIGNQYLDHIRANGPSRDRNGTGAFYRIGGVIEK